MVTQKQMGELDLKPSWTSTPTFFFPSSCTLISHSLSGKPQEGPHTPPEETEAQKGGYLLVHGVLQGVVSMTTLKSDSWPVPTSLPTSQTGNEGQSLELGARILMTVTVSHWAPTMHQALWQAPWLHSFTSLAHQP